MAVTFDPRTGVVSWDSDTDEVTRTQFQTTMLAIAATMALSSQGVASARPAAGKRGRFWLSTDTGIIELDDGVQWRIVGSRTRGQTVQPPTAADVALTVQGLASQSGALQAWLDSAGAVLASLSAAGLLTVRQLSIAGQAGGSSLFVVGGDSAQVPLQVKGAAGQTADLQVWKNAAAQIIARLNAIGGMQLSSDLTVGGTARAGNVVVDDALTAAGPIKGATGRFTTDIAAPNLTGSSTSGVAPHNHRVKTISGGLLNGVAAVVDGWTNEAAAGNFAYADGVWTIPVKGRWLLTAEVAFEQNATGHRTIYFTRNGASIAATRAAAVSNSYTTVPLSTVRSLNAGDLVDLRVLQNSGVTLDVGAPQSRVTLDYLGASA